MPLACTGHSKSLVILVNLRILWSFWGWLHSISPSGTRNGCNQLLW
jgi:hypothetical protein